MVPLQGALLWVLSSCHADKLWTVLGCQPQLAQLRGAADHLMNLFHLTRQVILVAVLLLPILHVPILSLLHPPPGLRLFILLLNLMTAVVLQLDTLRLLLVLLLVRVPQLGIKRRILSSFPCLFLSGPNVFTSVNLGSAEP